MIMSREVWVIISIDHRSNISIGNVSFYSSNGGGDNNNGSNYTLNGSYSVVNNGTVGSEIPEVATTVYYLQGAWSSYVIHRTDVDGGTSSANTSGKVSFTDVDSSAWYCSAVEWAASGGISGYGDGRFCPCRLRAMCSGFIHAQALG